MDGEIRSIPGERLTSRLHVRQRRRPRMGFSPDFYARFGMDDPWAFEETGGGEPQGDGMVYLSGAPYYAMMRRLASARKRRERRMADFLARRSGTAMRAATRQWPGETAASLAVSRLARIAVDDMTLPPPVVQPAAPVEEQPTNTIGRVRAPYQSMRPVENAWWTTPFVPARVFSGSPTRDGEAGQTRADRADRATAASHAGQRIARAATGSSALLKVLEEAAPVATTRMRRALSRVVEIVEELPEAERAVEIRRVVRRLGGMAPVVRTVIEESEATAPPRPTVAAARRMAAPGSPTAGLRTVLSRSPSMALASSAEVDRAAAGAAAEAERTDTGRKQLSALPRRQQATARAARRALAATPVASSSVPAPVSYARAAAVSPLSANPIARAIATASPVREAAPARGADSSEDAAPARGFTTPASRTERARTFRTPASAHALSRSIAPIEEAAGSPVIAPASAPVRSAGGAFVSARVFRTPVSERGESRILAGLPVEEAGEVALSAPRVAPVARAAARAVEPEGESRSLLPRRVVSPVAQTLATAAPLPADDRVAPSETVRTPDGRYVPARVAVTPAGRTVASVGHVTPTSQLTASRTYRTPAGRLVQSETHHTPAGEHAASRVYRTPRGRLVQSEAFRTPAGEHAAARAFTTPDGRWAPSEAFRTPAGDHAAARTFRTADGKFVGSRAFTTPSGEWTGARGFTTPTGEWTGARGFTTPTGEWAGSPAFTTPASPWTGARVAARAPSMTWAAARTELDAPASDTLRPDVTPERARSLAAVAASFVGASRVVTPAGAFVPAKVFRTASVMAAARASEQVLLSAMPAHALSRATPTPSTPAASTARFARSGPMSFASASPILLAALAEVEAAARAGSATGRFVGARRAVTPASEYAASAAVRTPGGTFVGARIAAAAPGTRIVHAPDGRLFVVPAASAPVDEEDPRASAPVARSTERALARADGVASATAYRGAYAGAATFTTPEGEFEGARVARTPWSSRRTRSAAPAATLAAPPPPEVEPELDEAGSPAPAGRRRARRVPLEDRLGAVSEGRGAGAGWSLRAEGAPPRAMSGLFDALARATTAEQVVRVIMARAEGTAATPPALPMDAPAVQVIQQIRQEVAREVAQPTLVEQPHHETRAVTPPSEASNPTYVTPVQSTARSFSGGVRGVAAGARARSASSGDERITKLVKKLQNLIHLAEAERRLAEARSQVRMAEASAAAVAEASGPVGDGKDTKGLDKNKQDIEALGREVAEVVFKEIELRRLRRMEDRDESGWW
ncbi:MAG: hypothetical protein ACOZNI_02795 [Myxococcota bacterium]